MIDPPGLHELALFYVGYYSVTLIHSFALLGCDVVNRFVPLLAALDRKLGL